MGVGTQKTGRKAVIIASRVDVLESVVRSAGYDVVGASGSAVNGEHLLRHAQPDVVVVENDLLGTIGWDAIPGLRAASPSTEIILVVTENWTPRDLGSSGAFAVVTRSRLEELVTALDGVAALIAGRVDQVTTRDDRRTGCDRRIHQDWTKVGWQRRNCERRVAAATG